MKDLSNKLDYLIILFMLLASGSAYFYMLHTSFTILSFFTIAVIKWLYSGCRFVSNLFGKGYLVLIVAGIIIHGFNVFYFTHLIYLLGTMMSLSTMTFSQFKKVFFNVVYFISIISLILYILYIFHIIEPHLIQGATDGYYLFLYNNFGHSNFGMHDRMCSIFWEPGIYQIVLNSAILFNLDKFKTFNIKDKETKKILLLVLCLFLTRSTTGYIIFALIMMFILKNIFSGSKYSFLLTGIATLGVFFFFLGSSVIIDKFSEDNISFLIRFEDTFSLIKILNEKPILGLGVNSSLFQKYSMQYGTIANSNGLLLQCTQYGLIWLFLYLISLSGELKRMKLPIPTVFLIGIVLLLNVGEPLTYTPLLLCFTIKFKKYGKNTFNNCTVI